MSACLLGVPCRWKGDARPCEGVLRLAERAVVRTLDPATRRAMEKHHAESAEFVSHAESAESAEFVSHAESAEFVSHAESAENAEFVSHAESAENAEVVSHAESAESAEVELVPFCPELAAGLGCPRPPIELVEGAVSNPSTTSTISTSSTLQPRGSALPIRVLRVDRKGDATDALRAACEAEAEALERAGGVDGFVLKARSPSCGLASPLHDAAGREIGTAPGLWAALAAERFPSAERVDEAHFSRGL